MNIKDNTILNLNNKIDHLEEKINNFNKNNNIRNTNVNLNDIIAVSFKSLDFKVDLPLQTHKSELFVRLEEKLYENYPEYKDTNNYFTHNGMIIKRFATIQENNIKNSDIIILNVME